MNNSQGKPENGNSQGHRRFLGALGAGLSAGVPPSKQSQLLADLLDLKQKQIKIKDEEDKISQRRTYFNISICVGISWLVFTTLVICANGLNLFNFSVSDKIVIALIGSSSIPSLTLVGKYLFSRLKD